MQFKNISIEVTNECNLDCKHCYNHWKCEPHFDVLNSYKQSVSLINQICKRANVQHITFTGGEPFMAERFLEVVLHCRLQQKTVSIITNGTIAKPSDYKRCIEMGVLLFQIPVLSDTAEIHDSITGVQGSWQKAVDSISYIRKNKGVVVPVFVITAENVARIEQTFEYLRLLGIRQIMLNRYNIGGKYMDAHVSASHTDIQKAFEIANSMVEKYGMYITSNVCTPMCFLNPKEFPRIPFGFCSDSIQDKPITISIDGNVRVCNHSPIVAGNIFTQSFEEINNSAYVQSWKTTKPEFCSDCTLFEQCKGGCRAASEQVHRSLQKVDPIVKMV